MKIPTQAVSVNVPAAHPLMNKAQHAVKALKELGRKAQVSTTGTELDSLRVRAEAIHRGIHEGSTELLYAKVKSGAPIAFESRVAYRNIVNQTRCQVDEAWKVFEIHYSKRKKDVASGQLDRRTMLTSLAGERITKKLQALGKLPKPAPPPPPKKKPWLLLGAAAAGAYFLTR